MPTRISKFQECYSHALYFVLYSNGGEQECLDEALYLDTYKQWELIMDEEIDSLTQNQTWDLVELPAGKKALHNKWVYIVNEERGGNKRYKEILLVKGFV